MTAEQFERLKSELEAGFQGAAKAGRPLLLEGGLDWKPLSLSPKDMDFYEARNSAAREIALALGVPPMLLGIPGDNTYSNYQEAQRALWRNTVLPLVHRTAKAFSAWLAPAYGGNIQLKPDLDQVEALTSEREALWARIDRVSFLTLNEKRAAVGYAPIDEAGLAPATQPSALSVLRKYPAGGGQKYRPDQPRAPAGASDGGQWVDDGGGGGSGGGGSGGGGSGGSGGRTGKPGSGRVRVPLNDTGIRDDASPTAPDTDNTDEGDIARWASAAAEGGGDEPPKIPNEKPPKRKDQWKAVKIATKIARETPIGKLIAAIGWLAEFTPYITPYFDEPKSLEELQLAAHSPAKGYDIHHIVEQTLAERDGFPRSQIDSGENLVRIPTLKHWELNAWWETKNKAFGMMTPRQYVRGKSWEERMRLGKIGLQVIGVLKK